MKNDFIQRQICKLKFEAPKENGELTENAQKGSLVDCQEDVPYTALTVVWTIKTINVRLDGVLSNT